MTLVLASCVFISALNAAFYFYEHARGRGRVLAGFFSAFVSGAAFASFVYLVQFSELFRFLGVQR